MNCHSFKMAPMKRKLSEFAFSAELESDSDLNPTMLDYHEHPTKGNDAASVWMHFLKSSTCFTKCKLCGKFPKVYGGGSTAGLLSHLASNHKEEFDKLKVYQEASKNPPKSKSKPTSSNSLSIKPVTNEFSLEELVARLIAVRECPINQLTTKEYQSMLAKCFGEHLVPSTREGFIKLFMRYQKQTTDSLKTFIKQRIANGDRFTLSFGELKGLNQKRYLSMNLHLTRDRFVNLGLVAITGTATPENLRRLIIKRLTNFGLNAENHLIAIQTDGCSTLVRLEELLHPVRHQVCYAHALQLAIIDVLYKMNDQPPAEADCDSDSEQEEDENWFENLDEQVQFDDLLFQAFEQNESEASINEEYAGMINKVRRTGKIFRGQVQNKILQRHVKERLGKELNLIVDTKTRWTSLYEMILRFIELFDCIILAFDDIKKTNTLQPKDHDLLNDFPIDLAKDLCKALAVLNCALLDLSSSSTTLLDACSLKDFIISELNALKTSVGTNLIKTVKARFNPRTSIFTEILNYLKCKTVCDALMEADVLVEIEKLAIRLFEEEEKIVIHLTPSSYHQSSLDTSLVADRLKEFRKSLEKGSVESYVPQAGSSFEKKLNAEISFFQQTNSKGEILTKLFDNLLKIKPSTVNAEKIFSASDLILTRLRCRLSDQLLDSIVFMRCFLNNRQNYSL